MADYSDPKRATAYRFTLSLYARSDNQIKVTPTLAAGDVKVSKDNGATANITTLPAETPASSGILQVDLSATEMTADLVTIIFRDAAGAEWNDVAVNIAPSTVQMADLATAAALTTVDDLLDTEVAAIKTVVDAILVDTAEIGAAGAGLTVLATQASVNTIDDFLDTEVAAILAAVDTEVATIVSQTTAANIRAAVGLASANLDTQIGDIPTNAELATSQAAADDATLAAIAALSIPTAAAVADAVWDEDATAHQTQGTFGQAIGDPVLDTDTIWGMANTNLDAAVSTRLASASYTAPLDAAGTRTAVGLASANLDTQLADLPTNAELATALGTADDAVLTQVALVKAKTDLIPASPAATGDIPTADITAIKAKTDSLAFTLAGKVDANIEAVNGAAITGTGSTADPWGP